MRKQPLTFICFFFASVLITSTVLVVATSQFENNQHSLSSPETTTVSEYDPWCDLNGDGKIDIFDVVMVAGKYGTSGDPHDAKAALEYDSSWLNITDKAGEYFNITHNLNSTDIIIDIQGKTTLNGGTHQRNLGGTGYTQESNRAYGGADDDVAYSVVETGDGGYALAGYTLSFGAGGYDFWLVKTDSAGNIVWNQTYGGTVRKSAGLI